MPYSAERACFGTSASSLTRGWVTGLQALLAYLLTNSAGGELALVSKEGTLGCSLCFSDFAMVGVIFSWKWLSYFKDITYVDAGLSRFHLAVSASDLSPICHLLLGTVYLCLFSLIAEPDKLVQGLCLSSMLNHWNLARVCIGLDPKKHHWHNLTH